MSTKSTKSMKTQRHKAKGAGLTLVELMVAMALMTVLTGTIVFIFTQAQNIFVQVDAKGPVIVRFGRGSDIDVDGPSSRQTGTTFSQSFGLFVANRKPYSGLVWVAHVRPNVARIQHGDVHALDALLDWRK